MNNMQRLPKCWEFLDPTTKCYMLYKRLFSHKSLHWGHSGGNETKWNCSQWNPHACTHMHQQLKFKTTRLHAAHRAIPAYVCSLLQLCKHKCQSLCKRANKMALSVYPLLIVLQQCTDRKQHCKQNSREDVSRHGWLQYRPQTPKRSEW